MTELSGFLAQHCLLVVDDTLVAHALATLARLSRHDFAPAPLIVCDVIAASVADELQVNLAWRNEARDMLEWLRQWRRALERVSARPTERLARAELLLETLMADAPSIPADATRRTRLEAVALLDRKETLDGAEAAWVAWRRALEDRLGLGRDPTFSAALVQLRESGAVGFGTCDEGLWQLRGHAPAARSIRVTASSRQSFGDDHERFRDLRGPFETLSSYTMPPDPGRLVSTELALVAARSPGARAMLAAKLADGSMTVRFGSVELPAKRRARCLLVVTLCDAIRHHHQGPEQPAPEVDFLRAVLVHALPCAVLTFAGQGFDTALEVRRDGPLRTGSYRLPSVRTKSGLPLPSFSDVDATLAQLDEALPWMLDDAPARAPDLPTPRTEAFDACVLIAIGEQPSWGEGVAPTVQVIVQAERPGSRRLLVAGSAAQRGIVDVSALGAYDIAALAVEQCGAALTRQSERRDESARDDRWDGTIFT